MPLLFLESVGTTELLLILVVALIIFGPRKLPELSRSLGKGLNEFRRASDEFKRTWEREVEMESYERQRRLDTATPGEELPASYAAGEDYDRAPYVAPGENSIARGSGTAWASGEPTGPTAADDRDGTDAGGGATDVVAEASGTPRPQPAAKSDWV